MTGDAGVTEGCRGGPRHLREGRGAARRSEAIGGNGGGAEGFQGREMGFLGPDCAVRRPRRGRTEGRRPAGLRVPRRRLGTSLTCTGSFSWPPEPERPQREPPNPRPAEPPPPACAMLEVTAASDPPPLEPRSRLRRPHPLGARVVMSL